MPKIITREFDNSNTGITLAPSFGVVVPGFSGKYFNLAEAQAAGAPYDENGVIELSSTAQFETYVGKFKREYKTESTAKEAPTDLSPEAIRLTTANYTVQEDTNSRILKFKDIFTPEGPLTQAAYIAKKNAGVTLYYKENGAYIVSEEWVSGKTYYSSVFDTILVDCTNLYRAIVKEPADEVYGYRQTKTYVFAPFTYTNALSLNADDTYALLATEGTDYVEGIKVSTDHIGNQIAYMLLQLGYPVLFKLLARQKHAADAPLTALGQLNDEAFWEPLKDTTVYDFRYLTHGGEYDPSVASLMSKVATFNNDVTIEKAGTLVDTNGRGDIIALVDVDENFANVPFNPAREFTVQEKTIYQFAYKAQQLTEADTYTAIFCPRVIYNLSDSAVAAFGNNKTFPASFHYLACAAYAQRNYAEWYAVAGYDRGISTYSIAGTTYKLGSIAVNSLSPRTQLLLDQNTFEIDGKLSDCLITKAINIIRYNRGAYHLWTNRTAHTISTELKFSDFLNIRQLCTTIKKTTRQACDQYTFDPNSDLLWINFTNAIEPMLQNMKNDQGIRGYKVSKVANDKKALMTARIRIVPIEAVEDFDISLYLEDSLEGIIVSADETEVVEED